MSYDSPKHSRLATWVIYRAYPGRAEICTRFICIMLNYVGFMLNFEELDLGRMRFVGGRAEIEFNSALVPIFCRWPQSRTSDWQKMAMGCPHHRWASNRVLLCIIFSFWSIVQYIRRYAGMWEEGWKYTNPYIGTNGKPDMLYLFSSSWPCFEQQCGWILRLISIPGMHYVGI